MSAINYDIGNATAEVDTLFASLQEAYNEIVNTPGVPEGLVREAQRQFNAEVETVDEYRNQMNATMGRLDESVAEFNRIQALLAEAVSRAQERG